MPYGTGTITSATPTKDLMNVLAGQLTAAGYSRVDQYSSPTASNTWASVAYGNGVFVTVAASSATAASSPDGVTWTRRDLPVSANWSSVAYGGGLFAAVVNGSTIAATSPDGITWTQRTLPVSANWKSVTYGGGMFAAVVNGSTIAASSPDGITWTQRTLPVSAGWYAVTYGDGMFAAVANSSAIAASSPDGITWTQRSLPSSQAWRSAGYGGGLFVTLAASTAIAASSPDGITWTTRSLSGAVSSWASVCYGGGTFVAVGTNSVAATSPDGITWTQRTLPGIAATWNSVAYGGGKFVAVPTSQAITASSPDGFTWTSQDLVGTEATSYADVYKSPAGSNSFGSDWYLILRRSADSSLSLWYQIAEGYDLVTRRISNYGPISGAVVPLPGSYTYPGLVLAPDSQPTGSAALTLTTTVFSYWWSITSNRLIVGVKTASELGFYAGLYEDLLPAAVSPFPLVSAKFPAAQVTAGAIGSGSVLSAGGFTREPLQRYAVTTNFDAAIHNGYHVSTSGVASVAFTPMTTSSALYGNTNTLARVPVGSTRTVTNTADAVRGLLYDCYACVGSSAAGDTIAADGKTYVRVVGAAATYGFFVDQGI